MESDRVDPQMLDHLLEGTEHRRQLGQMSMSPGGMVTQCQSQGMLKLFGQRSLLVRRERDADWKHKLTTEEKGALTKSHWSSLGTG